MMKSLIFHLNFHLYDRKQFELYNYIPNVISADSNMMMKMATQFCTSWITSSYRYDEKKKVSDGMHSAFQLSCTNIYNEWQRIFRAK